jgi:hypothetical protein
MNGVQPRRSGVEELGHKLHHRCISGIVFEKQKAARFLLPHFFRNHERPGVSSAATMP